MSLVRVQLSRQNQTTTGGSSVGRAVDRVYFPLLTYKEHKNVPIPTARTDSLEVRTPGESPGDVGSNPSPFIITTFRSFSFTSYAADQSRRSHEVFI